jgi:hypothetical protein
MYRSAVQGGGCIKVGYQARSNLLEDMTGHCALKHSGRPKMVLDAEGTGAIRMTAVTMFKVIVVLEE